ncbi:hypothetical protein Dpoa2040_002128 [Dickeya sp. CFBP 2040]|nr:hypothetical protein [Dickeya sp. CFBP 2040]
MARHGQRNQQRLPWVKLYETSGDMGLVYSRCGISCPTLRSWWIRDLALMIAVLNSTLSQPYFDSFFLFPSNSI